MRGIRLVRAGRVAAVVAATIVVGFTWAPQVLAQDEIVARGNQAYQEGRWAEAIEAYEAVQAGGFNSAGLEYNLGNAWFKAGELGRAILHWERSLARDPGNADVQANLELARGLTVDAVEPLPTFWLSSVVSWWIDLLPRGLLIALVAAAWLTAAGGAVTWILGRSDLARTAGRWALLGAGLVVAVLGTTLVVRESGIARPERAVILVEEVAVRSAPAEDDDLTLFQIHEGTRVRLDQRTGAWAEVVLDDGKVGWVPLAAMETI
jgi:tetratricopeptide (TPR) repeat protein